MCAWLYSLHRKEILQPALENVSGLFTDTSDKAISDRDSFQFLVLFTDIQWHKWTLDNLLALILTISKHGGEYVYSLTRAFYLFDPVSNFSAVSSLSVSLLVLCGCEDNIFVFFPQDNMLLPFMRFYEAFAVHMDVAAAGTQLCDFVVQHKSVRQLWMFINVSCSWISLLYHRYS
jgi:hypothetical protein